MSHKEEQKSSGNSRVVIWGTLSGLFSVIFISEFFQALTAVIFNAGFGGFVFFDSVFYCRYSLPDEMSQFLKIIISLSPILYSIISLEISLILLKKTKLGFWRFYLILFIIINAGYLIIKFFYGAFAVILAISENDWENFIGILKIEGNGKIPVVFFLIVILIAYLNIVSKRLMNYLENSKGGFNGFIKK